MWIILFRPRILTNAFNSYFMTVLITGASSGIGCELAKIFAREGYDLVLVARRGDRLESLKQLIQTEHSVQITTIVQDLSFDGGAEHLFEMLAGRSIDILVNNAGSGDVGMFVETDPQKTERMLHLNILSLASLTRLILPSMIARQSGKILNVASIAAFFPGPTMASYFASKAFVLSFSEALSNELEGTGVSVTILCPGSTSTEFDRAAGSDWGEAYRQKIPRASEVAEFGFSTLMAHKRIAVYGWKNRVLIFLIRFIPRHVVVRISRVFLSSF